jgi:prepilin-type N-terminal cleavage/methylation domain-containing protein
MLPLTGGSGGEEPWRILTAMRPLRGFSLLELIVVMAMIGILATLAGFYLRPPAHVVAANDLQALFQQARVEAVTRNRAVAVTFQGATGTFEVLANTTGGAVSCSTGTSTVRTLALSEYPRVTATVTIPSDGFLWLPNGLVSACSTGSLPSANVEFVHNGQTARVVVTPAGRVVRQ